MIWKVKITHINIVPENHDCFVYKSKMKKEFESKAAFLKAREKLEKFAAKKYGEGSKVELIYTEKE